MSKTNLKTPVGQLKWVIIKGEGLNKQIDKTKPANYCYQAVLVVPENSKESKAIDEILSDAWTSYGKKEASAIGKVKCAGWYEETIANTNGDIDPETGRVQRVKTGNMCLSTYTGVKFQDGKPKIVKVYGKTSVGVTDITDTVNGSSWTIGNDSLGIIHGTIVGNKGGGKPKLTIYLNGIQLTKLSKYDGSNIELDEEVVSEELDLGELPIVDYAEEVEV